MNQASFYPLHSLRYNYICKIRKIWGGCIPFFMIRLQTGSQGVLVVMNRASHLCEPGSTLASGHMWAEFQSISTWLQGFSPGTLVFLLPQNRLPVNYIWFGLLCSKITHGLYGGRRWCLYIHLVWSRWAGWSWKAVVNAHLPLHNPFAFLVLILVPFSSL